MRKQRFPRHILYAVLSVICPLVAFLGTLVYQSVANSSFWQSITPDESAAGGMMGFAEFVQLFFFTMIGCFVGLIFAVMSIWLWFEQRALRRFVDEE